MCHRDSSVEWYFDQIALQDLDGLCINAWARLRVPFGCPALRPADPGRPDPFGSPKGLRFTETPVASVLLQEILLAKTTKVCTYVLKI